MKAVRHLTLAALLGLLPARARALGEGVTSVQGAIAAGIDSTQHALSIGTAESVQDTGHKLAALMNGATPVFAPSLHQVQEAKVEGEASSISKMLDAGAHELSSRAGASSDLNGDRQLQGAMYDGQHLKVDGSLTDDEMGVYKFNKHEQSVGTIAINPWLAEIGKLVGHAFAAATLFHEAAHAADTRIDQEGVIDGEIPAFQIQAQWLAFIDPTGERLALLRVALDAQQRAYPNVLTQKAIDYARTLDVIRGTGGDPDKIRAMADALGYREGQGKTSVPLPAS